MQDNMGALTGSRASMEPAGSLHPTGFDPARDEIDAWLTVHCGKGLPYNDATDMASALHGLSYVLRQIEGTNSYKVMIGQTNAATTAIRWALDFIASQTMGAAPELDARTVRIVCAAREVAFGGHFDGCDDNGRVALKELDAASEKFAGDVPWEGEPDAIAINTRQGGDAKQTPSRSDESAAIAQDTAQDTTPVDAKKKG